MDLSLLPGGCGRGRSGQRWGAWDQLGRDLAGRAGDVFRLPLLPDAHLPRCAREHLQRESRERCRTCWHISGPLSLFPGILISTSEMAQGRDPRDDSLSAQTGCTLVLSPGTPCTIDSFLVQT